jgi:hypothetical protein
MGRYGSRCHSGGGWSNCLCDFCRHYRCSVLFALAYYVVFELTTEISSGQNCRLNRRLAGADPFNPCHNPPIARPK